jgi:hypothetical protein
MVRLGCRSGKFFEWKRGRPDENVAGKRVAATREDEQCRRSTPSFFPF